MKSTRTIFYFIAIILTTIVFDYFLWEYKLIVYIVTGAVFIIVNVYIQYYINHSKTDSIRW